MIQSLDISQNLPETVGVRIAACQTRGWSSLGPKQLHRHQKQPISSRLQVERLPIDGERG